jgi:hypothetical protein
MGVNLREAWNRVARADRFVYGVGLALVLLSFLAFVPEIARHFQDFGPGEADQGVDGNAILKPNVALRTFERNAQGLILGVAVLVVLGWEVAKEAYRVLSDSGPILVGVLVSVPVAAPLTALASWLAKLFAARAAGEEHPLFTHVLPLPVGVGITVYAMTTALVIVLLREMKASREEQE